MYTYTQQREWEKITIAIQFTYCERKEKVEREENNIVKNILFFGSWHEILRFVYLSNNEYERN